MIKKGMKAVLKTNVLTVLLTGATVFSAYAADYRKSHTKPHASQENASVPFCDNAGVMKSILRRQHTIERNILMTGSSVESIHSSYEIYPEDALVQSMIERRYCLGTAVLSNGHQRNIVYVIEAGQGFASIGWNVASCLYGRDPWYVHGECTALR
jgi:hypothetical protein